MLAQNKITISLLFFAFLCVGCMRFTERDYDLQKQAYEKERQIKEEKAKESLFMKW